MIFSLSSISRKNARLENNEFFSFAMNPELSLNLLRRFTEQTTKADVVSDVWVSSKICHLSCHLLSFPSWGKIPHFALRHTDSTSDNRKITQTKRIGLVVNVIMVIKHMQ